MKDKTNKTDGVVGEIHGINVLPNTATELAEAIYNQEDLSKEEAMEMAAYLDKRYKMSGDIPTGGEPFVVHKDE